MDKNTTTTNNNTTVDNKPRHLIDHEKMEKAIASGRIPTCKEYTGTTGMLAQIRRDASVGLLLLTRARLLSFFETRGYGVIAEAQATWEDIYATDLVDGNDGGFGLDRTKGIHHRLGCLGIDPEVIEEMRKAGTYERYAAIQALHDEPGVDSTGAGDLADL